MQRSARTAAMVAIALFAAAAHATAQSALLNLPDVSQHARVTQRIGITDITVDYHRPNVRGRKIFGGLQAYGVVWRAGADFNTTIEFTDSVTIEGRPLPKGVYGLHFVPGERSWIVIFSKNSTSWGSFTYDQSEDALRVTVTPKTIEHHETLNYSFDEPTPTSVLVTMRWERVAVPFTIEVNTPQIVARSLRNQIRGRALSEWKAWEEIANYLLENNLSAEEAAADADQSIAIEDRFENELTKARALTALGRTADAAAAQTKALSLGTQRQIFLYARNLQGIGQQERALAIFRDNIAKDPTSWIARAQISRIAVSKNDFPTAIREMKLALSSAPESARSALEDMVRQLENGVDINK